MGQKSGDGGLAAAGRPPQDEALQAAAGQHARQRAVGADRGGAAPRPRTISSGAAGRPAASGALLQAGCSQRDLSCAHVSGGMRRSITFGV